MDTRAQTPIPRLVHQALAGLAREQGSTALDAVLYPAGGLARALLQHGLPGPIRLVGVGDSDPALAGLVLGPFRILPPADLERLAPAAILVASTRFHLEIARDLEARWQGTRTRVIDLCAGLGPLTELEDEARRLGLELDGAEAGILTLTDPGPPRRRLRYRRSDWGNTPWLLRDFQEYWAGLVPDRQDPEEALVDLSTPGYHTLLPSRARLFYPAMVEREATIQDYLAFAELRPGDRVLDLGAYAGDSAWFFSRAVGPAGRVVAVEPDPGNLAALRRNVAEHRLGNVAVEGSALLDRDGEVRFQGEGSIGSGIAEASDQEGYELTVPAVTLATLMARHRLDRIDFVKMDIEGAELRVLEGNAALLRRLRPRMLIEPHFHRGVSNLPRVLALLAELGCAAEVRNGMIRARWQEP